MSLSNTVVFSEGERDFLGSYKLGGKTLSQKSAKKGLLSF